MQVSENKGNGKYPKFSYVRNIRLAKLIISLKNRGCPKTQGVRKLRVITVLLFYPKRDTFCILSMRVDVLYCHTYMFIGRVFTILTCALTEVLQNKKRFKQYIVVIQYISVCICLRWSIQCDSIYSINYRLLQFVANFLFKMLYCFFIKEIYTILLLLFFIGTI